MVLPDPAVAPEIPPVIVPTVHAKLLGALAVSAILVPVLLHIAFVAAVVTAGVGLTVTVIVYGDPTQPPVVDVGVTMYCTLPAVALLGLLSVWLMFAPDPAVAPVMLPLIVPIVQVNVLAALAVSGMLVVVALQIA
jgi:ABC-type proline/glycine betaine transport system permease subunit